MCLAYMSCLYVWLPCVVLICLAYMCLADKSCLNTCLALIYIVLLYVLLLHLVLLYLVLISLAYMSCLSCLYTSSSSLMQGQANAELWSLNILSSSWEPVVLTDSRLSPDTAFLAYPAAFNAFTYFYIGQMLVLVSGMGLRRFLDLKPNPNLNRIEA